MSHALTRSQPFSIRCLAIMLLGLSLACPQVLSEQPQSPSIVWSLRNDFRVGRERENPNADRDGHTAWHFLRTTSFEGSLEERRWLRDGHYEPLAEQHERLFDLPFDGWIFQATPAESPAVSRAVADQAGGLAVSQGDIVVAPGPQHAMIVGWQSPASGRVRIQGSFQHAQASSGITWYVERGSAPDLQQGSESIGLASGQARFGTETEIGHFAIEQERIEAGEFLYFVVDALADGTATPHHGDGTRLELQITLEEPEFPPPPTFEEQILPLLADHCFDCHSEGAQEAKLDLRSLSEVLRGGESGPAIVPGQPAQSLLIDLVARGQMPPDEGNRLSAKELSLLRQWVKAGAPANETVVRLPPHTQLTAADRDFWAFKPPQRSPLPHVLDPSRVTTTIDTFLLGQLESQGLTFSSDAERQVLIRRLHFDLIGLPPDPESVEAFVQDTRVDAHVRLVDRLLSSPQYGERWARHWLDAAGYVDGKLDNDLGSIYPHPGSHRYRDYVVRALNENMPIDQFLIEQLAGDELVDWRAAETFDERTISLLTATGFLRNVDDHTDFPQYGIEKRYEVINETLDMVSTSLLGLTMECCRCHNHKYDPLPQRDYYRLMACFEPAFNVQAWQPPKDRHLVDVSPSERAAIDQQNAELEQQIAELSAAENQLREQVGQRIITSRLAALPEETRQSLQQAVATAMEQRDEQQRSLIEAHTSVLSVDDVAVASEFTAEESANLKSSTDKRAQIASQKRSYGVIQALWDVGEPPVSFVHRRGNVHASGILVQPGFPEILQPEGSSLEAISPDVRGVSSGRRLALAQWLTTPEHPLTARVFVNRIWHHHFGRGIVETLGNFGRSGTPPTHPQLLDWLARDFIDHGWDLKRLHRQILLSTAYRQSSRRPPEDSAAAESLTRAEQIDPENRLLWRMNLRRLEAEMVRDATLAAAGNLTLAIGGPPIEITISPDGLSEAKPSLTADSVYRRSLYLFARRVYPLKFLEIFDAPIMPVNCTQRLNSATVLQSLAQLNSEFMVTQAEQMARRLTLATLVDQESRVTQGFQLALGRSPTLREKQSSLEFLRAQSEIYRQSETTRDSSDSLALADFCQMLLSANEFLYVE